jgi:hypothetical protein
LAGEVKASEREPSGSVSTGEIAEVADADKAPGQQVLAKAAQELGSAENHDALLIAMSIVFPSKAHTLTISQLPKREPSLRRPFTRWMPAASSGLSRPQSAASNASRLTAAKRTLIVPAERPRSSK